MEHWNILVWKVTTEGDVEGRTITRRYNEKEVRKKKALEKLHSSMTKEELEILGLNKISEK